MNGARCLDTLKLIGKFLKPFRSRVINKLGKSKHQTCQIRIWVAGRARDYHQGQAALDWFRKGPISSRLPQSLPPLISRRQISREKSKRLENRVKINTPFDPGRIRLAPAQRIKFSI